MTLTGDRPAPETRLPPGVRTVILTAFVVTLGFGIVTPILPLYARSFGVSYEAASLMIAAYGGARLVLDLFAGVLVDKYGERAMATVGFVVLTASAILTAVAPTFPLAVAFRGVMGAGSAVAFSALFSYVLKSSPPAKTARTLGLFWSSFNCGFIAGGPIGGVIAHRWGLAAPLFFYAGLQAVSGLLFLRFVPPLVVTASSEHASHPAGAAVRRLVELARKPGISTTLLLSVALGWTMGSVHHTLVPLLGRDRLGMTTVAIGAGFALAALAELTVTYPAGMAADRVGRKPIMIVGFAGLAATSAAFGWIDGVAAYYVLLTVSAMTWAVAALGATAMLSDRAPTAAKATTLGVYRFSGDAGLTVGPLVAGATTAAFGFEGGFSVAAIAAVVALVAVLRTSETLPRTVADARPSGGRLRVGPVKAELELD